MIWAILLLHVVCLPSLCSRWGLLSAIVSSLVSSWGRGPRFLGPGCCSPSASSSRCSGPITSDHNLTPPHILKLTTLSKLCFLGFKLYRQMSFDHKDQIGIFDAIRDIELEQLFWWSLNLFVYLMFRLVVSTRPVDKVLDIFTVILFLL